ncbi:MAG: CinA family protein [Alphaproteobacteria bacterium]|nr:CinA family protein [Alphaproteobacteria bacterium]
MFSQDLTDKAAKVIAAYAAQQKAIATAESCTGGLIAGALTSIPGSSRVFDRGFVTYSNDAKVALLGVKPETLERMGAVSTDVAEEMARGALSASKADIALSVTGIAGPDGGSTEKPVGLVFFGLATKDGALMHYRCQFSGDRDAVRTQTVNEGLSLLLSFS